MVIVLIDFRLWDSASPWVSVPSGKWVGIDWLGSQRSPILLRCAEVYPLPCSCSRLRSFASRRSTDCMCCQPRSQGSWVCAALTLCGVSAAFYQISVLRRVSDGTRHLSDSTWNVLPCCSWKSLTQVWSYTWDWCSEGSSGWIDM